MEKPKNKTLINLSTKTFIQVVVLLFVLMLVAIVLTESKELFVRKSLPPKQD